MKKLLVSICTLLFILSAPLSAFEWGGILKNDTGISTPDFKDITFKQSNALSLWFRAPFGDSGFSLTGEGLYKYNFTASKAAKNFVNIADITLFKLAGKINAGSGDLTLNAGRFSVSDATGAVFAQSSDGLSLLYSLPVVKLGLYAGYTGLLNGLNVSMTSAPEKNNKVYNLAYPYVPLGLTIDLPSLFLNQNLTIQGYALFDCGSAKTNLYYANLVLAGPVTNSVFYNISTSLGSANFKNFMNYTGFTLYIFPSQQISLNAGLDYGSAQNGKLAAFTSASFKGAEAAGNIIPRLGFTYGTDALCIDAAAKFLMAWDGGKYAASGTELNAGLVYNIFSDLQLGFSANAFLDATKAKANRYSANLNLSLAF